MRKLISGMALSLCVASAGAQVFDFGTYTLHLPQVTVGTAVYDVVLHYDADGRMSITRLAPTYPSIVGTWYTERSGASGEPKFRVAFTFLADGTYMMANDGNSTASDPTGQPGIEVGTYTFNPVNGAFASACPYINTDGRWGLSNSDTGSACPGAHGTASIQGDTMTLTTSGGSTPLTRVTP
jgi:hypothetical protein